MVTDAMSRSVTVTHTQILLVHSFRDHVILGTPHPTPAPSSWLRKQRAFIFEGTLFKNKTLGQWIRNSLGDRVEYLKQKLARDPRTGERGTCVIWWRRSKSHQNNDNDNRDAF